jgi:hypothetical protein
MRVLDIGLMLERNNRADMDIAPDFEFQNRFIGNYLTRISRIAGVVTVGYNRIALIAKVGQIRPPFVEDKFLNVELLFDQASYERARKEELPGFFYEMYLSGIELAKNVPTFPYSILKSGLEEFRRNEYRNEWKAKSKTFREINATASLHCRMTIDYFALFLEIRREDQILFRDEILHTLPDEIFFSGEFEDIRFENRQISVLNKLQGRIFYIDWPIVSK